MSTHAQQVGSVASGRTCRGCGSPLGPRSTGTVCPRCALKRALAPDPPPEESPAGTLLRQFGGYEIHAEIGRGGMGVIYKARHVRLRRWVALKVMAGGESASPDFKQRFRTEAEAAAALEHPNIVPIYEVGEEDGQPYFSMKLVEGGTLTSWRPVSGPQGQAARPDVLRAIAGAVATVARAVQYAHDRGVLHRDLKPNNVLVDGSGGLFLTDFGLARLMEGDSTLTRTRAVLGTPAYMAPEQARGDTRQLTTGADVYGLGAILYELIAGRPPFVGASAIEVMRQVTDREPAPPGGLAGAGASAVNRTEVRVARDLDTICLKCLEKNPARRYASAGALADDLQRWLDRDPILARPASRPERIGKWVRRRPALAALYATAAVSLLALGIASVLFTMQVVQARAAAERANRDLRRNLFIREWQEAETLAAQDKAAGALVWFARAVRENPDNLALSTRLVSLLSEHSFALPHRPPITNDVPIRTVALSPDDSRLLTADFAGRIRCRSVADGKELWTLPRNFTQPGAAFVAGGDMVLVVDQTSVSLWPAGGGAGPLREVAGADVSAFDVSADGRRLAVARRNQRVEVRDTGTLDRVLEMPGGDGENFNFLKLSRDGRRLLRSHGSELRVFDGETGRWLWRGKPVLETAGWYYARADFTGDGGSVVGLHMAGVLRGQLAMWPMDSTFKAVAMPVMDERPAMSAPAFPESSGILVAGDSSRVLVWARSGLLNCHSIRDGKRVLEPVEHAGAVAGVAEASAGGWVAVAADKTVCFWDFTMSVPTTRIHMPGTVAGGARFGPDTNWFAMSGDGAVRLFNTDDGTPRLVLEVPGRVRDIDLSRDGRRMVATSTEAGVVAWDTTTGVELSRMEPRPPILAHLAISPDGTRYAASISESDLVRVHSVKSGLAAMLPLTNEKSVVNAQFSPDGRRLAVVTTSGLVALWDLPEGGLADREPPKAVRREVEGRHDGVVWSAGFSEEGSLLVTASNDRTARLWDVETGRTLREFRHQKPVHIARFAPGGRHIFTGGSDHFGRIWDAGSGQPVGEPMQHPGGVWYAEFSGDGKVLLTGDDTGHARVWDAATGLPLNGWVKHGSSLRRARITSDARLALAVSVDDGVRLWRPLLAPGPAPAWLPELAEAVAGARQLDSRTVDTVPPEHLAVLRARLVSSRDTDFYSRWARWFFVERMRPDPPPFQ